MSSKALAALFRINSPCVRSDLPDRLSNHTPERIDQDLRLREVVEDATEGAGSVATSGVSTGTSSG